MKVKDFVKYLSKFDEESEIYLDHGNLESGFGLCTVRQMLIEMTGSEKEADFMIEDYGYNPASPVISGRD